MRKLGLYFSRFTGIFFLMMAFLQFQDGFVDYAFVSLGIASIVLYLSFRDMVRSRKPLD
jgi:hypothetical protein